jgi:hypothetical protein
VKPEGEPENKPKNPEQEKKQKEIEIKRRRADNLAKQGLQPPIYSEEEKKVWKAQADDYINFVKDLIKRAEEAG